MIYLADMLRIQNAQLSLFPLPSITSPKIRVFAFSTRDADFPRPDLLSTGLDAYETSMGIVSTPSS